MRSRRIVHLQERTVVHEKQGDGVVDRSAIELPVVARSAAAAEATRYRLDGIVLRQNLCVIASHRWWVERDGHRLVLADENDSVFYFVGNARQINVELVLSRKPRSIDLNDFGADDTVRARGPCEDLRGENVFHRRDDMGGQTFAGPTGMTEIPRLEVRIFEPPLCHLLDRPVACRFEIGRAGEPRTVAVRKHVERGQNLRVFFGLASNLPLDVGLSGHRQWRREGETCEECEQARHGLIIERSGYPASAVRSASIPADRKADSG